MTTTLTPIKSKRRQDCSRCYGTATHRILVDGKKTGLAACCWCTPRVADGRLIVIGKQLVEPIRRKAKMTGES